MIVVVSGLPRSGTSLVMQMLHAGGYPVLCDDQRKADEDNPRGYFEYQCVRKLAGDASWLSEAEGKAIKVVSPLLGCLPAQFEYRVLFVERDLEEVIRSQQAMLRRRGEKGAGVPVEHLRQVFKRHVSDVLARLAACPHMRVLRMEYRKLVERPRECAKQIADFIGAPLDVAAMTSVVDARLYRQRAGS